jgi:hypothetical protein
MLRWAVSNTKLNYASNASYFQFLSEKSILEGDSAFQ